MADSFFFYDLETTGFNPRQGRIMQFAGQRTAMDLKPIGEPVNVLIKLTPDVLPSPDAVLVTGITPQKTLAEGITEAEFLKLFYEQVKQHDTIFVGYNNIRFDDEFMRFLHWRNFYDAYEWHWKDNCSRWDLLDVVRMTRALRPAGMEWPFAPDGKPTNRLEFLTKVNRIEHAQAHEALSDVKAIIAVAKLIQNRQPDLFNWLLQLRHKSAATKLIEAAQPFVYTSGRYPSKIFHTTIAAWLTKHPTSDGCLVYDLRHDPTLFLGMDVEAMTDAWRFSKDEDKLRLPVKTVKYNRNPAVAPLGVIKDQASQDRISLNLATATKHLALLRQHRQDFSAKVLQALERLDAERIERQASLIEDPLTVDERLYDGFTSDADRQLLAKLRNLPPADLNPTAVPFKDERLRELIPLYKARNYPSSLNAEERVVWEKHLQHKLLGGDPDSRLARYFNRLRELSTGPLTGEQQYLLEELKLYGESITPVDVAG